MSGDYDTELALAGERVPFSNGFEWECWSAEWCERCAREVQCALPMVALLAGRTPAAWHEIRPGGLADRYTCTEWEVA